MGADLWLRARSLFDVLIALPPEQRTQSLAEHCGADEELRRTVQTLLRSHEALPDTIDDPVAREIRGAIGRIWPAVAPGQRFGAFAIIEEIGRGGMGSVYWAERDDGTVTQRVALKIVGHAGLDAEASRRLSRERRLLATLEHPNIARLIDAGEDASGVPYFAMEYVSGLPITTYCERHALSLIERLRLFRHVCAAVQYAHANSIVHCDLKPSNILVTESGVPKLLDFGIAASLDAGLSAPDDERRFFSPHAAAPEQLLGQPVGVAMDVYALGVLLCELSGGRRPFDLSGLNAEDVQQRVLHEPPLLPSTATTDARRRRELRGDIDAIVAKALQKSPQQRYASVAHLDADVAAHLDLRPVSARADSRGYRIGRFFRRNALATIFFAIVGVLIVAFLVVTVRQNRRLAEERDQAQFERERAQQVTDFVIGLFRAADPDQARGRDITARELLARGGQRLQTDLGRQPDLRAAMLAAISDINLALDDVDGAQRSADEAARLRDAMQPPAPASQAASLRQLANLANRRGAYANALPLIERALALVAPTDELDRSAMLAVKATALEGLGKENDAIPIWRDVLQTNIRMHGEDDVRTLHAAMDLAFALRSAGLADEAERVLSDNLPRERSSFAADDPAVGETLLALAIFARNKGDLDKAHALATEGFDIYRRVYGEKSAKLASAANTLATIEQARGDYESARAHFEQALAIRRSVHGAESPQAAAAEYNLGLLLLARLHDPAQAFTHLSAANAIAEKTLAPAHVNLATYRLALGSALRELGRYAEAKTALTQAADTFVAINAPRGINLAIARGELACVALAEGASRDAQAELDAAIAALELTAHDDPQAVRLRDCAGKSP